MISVSISHIFPAGIFTEAPSNNVNRKPSQRAMSLPKRGPVFIPPPPVSPLTAIENKSRTRIYPHEDSKRQIVAPQPRYPPVRFHRRGAIDLAAEHLTPFGVSEIMFPPVAGTLTRGIGLVELLLGSESVRMPEGGKEVFEGCVERTLHLRIVWPGYPTSCERISVYSHTTHQELSVAVAQAYSQFVQANSGEVTPGQYTGWQWRLGPKGLGLDNMRLIRIVNTEGDTWQADINVTFA